MVILSKAHTINMPWDETNSAGVRHLLACVQVSGLRSQVSGLRSQVSGLRSQVSGLRFASFAPAGTCSGLSLQLSSLRPSIFNSLRINYFAR
jgi:hypothetical protein